MALARSAVRTVFPQLRTTRTRWLHATSARRDVETAVETPALPVEEDPHPAGPLAPREGWLYVDSIFPIRLGQWDIRHYIAVLRSDSLLAQLDAILESVHSHEFQVVNVENHPKDGGVFVHFRYTGAGSDADAHTALETIEKELQTSATKHGGVPSWTGLNSGSLWLVKGRPWNEDMRRWASPIVKVAFDGPDLQEESLYNLLRPYGRIQDLSLPTPVPAGSLRSATVGFRRISSAVIARNVIHGVDYVPAPNVSGTTPPRTRLRLAYQPPVQAHAIRDWITSHPRIVGPVVLFLLGSLTYTIFDPIRVFMVESKVLDWFDYREYGTYKWLQENVLDRIPFLASATPSVSSTQEKSPESPGQHEHEQTQQRRKEGKEDVWQERQDAEGAIEKYLTDLPTTIAFVHGPQGSGKSRMLESIVHETGRKTLIIDCGHLLKSSSDSPLVTSLARQTGYWPIFTFLNSFNNWIDLASVGLIGQKAGLATSLPDQVQQILDVVGTALADVSKTFRKNIKKKQQAEAILEERKREDARRRDMIRRGEWHDGRLDDVAGTGLITELGIGDERIEEWAPPTPVTQPKDEGIMEHEVAVAEKEAKALSEEVKEAAQSLKHTADGWTNAAIGSLPSIPGVSSLPSVSSIPGASAIASISARIFGTSSVGEKAAAEAAAQEEPAEDDEAGNGGKKGYAASESDAVTALPILVIKNFAARAGGHKDQEEVLEKLSEWAAGLAENKIAHVVVMSDNRENIKRLAKAMPSKPLNQIALYDADTASSLSFVKQKLHEAEVNVQLDASETAYVERLGGRASDLESLVHKVRGGQTVQDAVDDIVYRDVSELRKNAFGDDSEDAKNLPWSREHAWQLFKKLAKQDEVAYYDALVDLFKNDELALRNMEHAELIAIGTNNGRPSTIRPGKPVYKYVFQQLVADPIFRATQDLASNEKAIASAEGVVKACEEELLRLKEVGSSRTARKRENYLLDKMHASQTKIENLEKQNVELKKGLAKGG